MTEPLPVTATQSAINRVGQILSKEDEGTALRISVEGGGCSGFSYKFDLDKAQNDDDFVIERDGAKIFIDSMSLIYLNNSVIDFVDDLIGQSFQIKNPNAVSSCGCGTSFSL